MANNETFANLSLEQVTDSEGPIVQLCTLFNNRGHELYLVGGSVRDAMLHRPIQDVDFATSATPEETKALIEPFAKSLWLQGERFGTIGADLNGIPVEITTYRTDTYDAKSRKPDVVFTTKLWDDLVRRDFTMNAIAFNPATRVSEDPFGGREAILNKEITTVDSAETTFADDPLRIMRAFRFAAQLNFRIEQSTLDAISATAHMINKISAERTRDELVKLILAPHAGRALFLMQTTGVMDHVLPEVSKLRIEQDPDNPKHKDIFAHTIAVMEKTPRELVVRLAALLHDTGKIKTRRFEGGKVSFHQHEQVSGDITRYRLKLLKFPNQVIDKVENIVRSHHLSHTFKLGWTDKAVRRYVHRTQGFRSELHAFVRCDCTTKSAKRRENFNSIMNALENRIAELQAKEELEALKPAVNGHEIMERFNIPPSALIGRMRDFLMEVRFDDGEIDKEDAFERLEKEFADELSTEGRLATVNASK